MARYPTSLDDATDPQAPVRVSTDTLPGPAALKAAIIALEVKLGTGDVTPSADEMLVGDGVGSSEWLAVTAQATISALVARLELKSVTVSLDEADLDALNTVPITLVPDPGDGFAIVIHRVLWDYDFDTAAYTAVSGTPVVEITDGTNVFAQYTIVAIAADQVFMDSPTSAIILPSEAIIAEVNSGQLQAGAGDLGITVFYTTIAV